MRILLGDDQPIFAALMEQLFSDHGDSVSYAGSDPADVLAMSARTACDLCLIGLGEESLSSLSQFIASRRSEVAPALMLLLADPGGAAVDRARRLKVDAVGTKDDDFPSIHTLAREAVRRKSLSGRPPALSSTARSSLAGRHTDPTIECLTTKEHQILEHLGAGADTSRMADALGVQVTTVRTHVASLMRKLGAHSRLELVATARRLQLIDLSSAHRADEDRHRDSTPGGSGRELP